MKRLSDAARNSHLNSRAIRECVHVDSFTVGRYVEGRLRPLRITPQHTSVVWKLNEMAPIGIAHCGFIFGEMKLFTRLINCPKKCWRILSTS